MRTKTIAAVAGCLLAGACSVGLVPAAASADPPPSAGCVAQTVAILGPPQYQPIGWYFSWLAQQPHDACFTGAQPPPGWPPGRG